MFLWDKNDQKKLPELLKIAFFAIVSKDTLFCLPRFKLLGPIEILDSSLWHGDAWLSKETQILSELRTIFS